MGLLRIEAFHALRFAPELPFDTRESECAAVTLACAMAESVTEMRQN